MDKGTIEFSLGSAPELAGRWPLRLLVLGEFLPRVYETEAPESRSFHRAVDKETFDEVMKAAHLRIRLDVSNPITDQPKELHLNLVPAHVKDFSPDAVAAAVPELAVLAKARELLGGLRQRTVTPEASRAEMRSLELPRQISEKIAAVIRSSGKPFAPAPTGTPAEPTDDRGLEGLLDIVDLGDEQKIKDARKAEMDRAISDFAGVDSSVAPIDASAINETTRQIDHLLGQAVDAIMHHPEFRRVEALWRGLRFLVERTDFRRQVKIEIGHCPKEKLLSTFTDEFYPPEYNGQSEVPLAAVVAAYEFTADTPDIELLRDLTEQAADLPVAVISAVAPTFFGCERTLQLEKLPMLTSILESPEHIKFNGLRKMPSSRGLALCCNRLLLRYPFGGDGPRARSFDYTETIRSDVDYLWGNPTWALASLLTGSQAQIGWPTNVSGRQDIHLENLPVRPIRVVGGEEATLGLETPVPDPRLREFDRCGIIPLLSDINTDMVYMLIVPSVHLPSHEPDPAKAERNVFMSSLPYQLYAGDIARFINRQLAELTAGADAGQIRERFIRALSAFNIARDDENNPGPVNVEVQEEQGRMVLAITVQSPRRVLHGRATVQMALPLRR